MHVKKRQSEKVARRAEIGFSASVPASKDSPGRRRSTARSAPETTALVAALGKRCRELRKRAGLTQQDAASRAGIVMTHLQVVERGAGNPTIAVLAALARAYGVTLPEMFTFPTE